VQTDFVVRRVTAFTRPYDSRYERYQAYYRDGLRLSCDAKGAEFRTVPMTRMAPLLRASRHVRDQYLVRAPTPHVLKTADRAARFVEGPLQTPSSAFHHLVGQYVFEAQGGEPHHVCIDAADYPVPPNDDLVAWSDTYFKTNYWPSVAYPQHVRPLVNGDPLILGRIDALRALRAQPKEVDLCFVARVWGGRKTVEGVEHNLRLLEALSRARCSKTIVAVLVAGDVDAQAQRLNRLDITCRRKMMNSRELWDSMARARLNVVRLGMHRCIPWRMAGTLAIGACLVVDQPPPSRWPEPLRENVNFLELGAATSEDAIAASYEQIPERIEAWLQDPETVERIGRANASYFDRYADPSVVGASIVAAVESRWQ
jgi:hypothetical protein